MSYPPTNTDIVSLSGLHLAATIGPDHWQRIRPQPISLSLHLHLVPSYLDTPGQSDSVADSLHYGHLAKAVEKRVGAKAERNYTGAKELVDDVTDAAFRFAMDAGGNDDRSVEEVVHAVRVVLELPKQILLAGSFQVERITPASEWRALSTGKAETGSRAPGAIVRVSDLALAVLIGVNPPERLAKQRVITYLTFFEASPTRTTDAKEVDYPGIVQQVAKDMENSAHLTLEKLVYEIIQTAYRASNAYSDSNISRFDAITVRCQKPSALSFADFSGVEMTRTRRDFDSLGNVDKT